MDMAKGETPVGRNTVSGQALLSFIERIERIREAKKECADDEKLAFAELTAAGFRPATVRDVLKRRAAKPADVEDAETMLDQYLHAIGMRSEPPLFRYFGLSDSVTREQSIEALKLAVPPGGEIIVRGNGTPVRIWRDDKGEAHVEDYVEAPKPASRPEGGGTLRASAAARGAGRRRGGSLRSRQVRLPGKPADHVEPLPLERQAPPAVRCRLARGLRVGRHGA